MNKIITFITTFSIAVILMAIVLPLQAKADSKTFATSAAFIQTYMAKEHDVRAEILRDYLLKQNSPLAGSAKTFVTEADKYNLNWKLVAAISGLESGFGKQIPPASYNGWGWGVYGTNVKYFASWDDAISTISQGLREQYMNRWGATDVYSIGHIYAASPTWAIRVEHFMDNIDTFQDNWTTQSLSVSF